MPGGLGQNGYGQHLKSIDVAIHVTNVARSWSDPTEQDNIADPWTSCRSPAGRQRWSNSAVRAGVSKPYRPPSPRSCRHTCPASPSHALVKSERLPSLGRPPSTGPPQTRGPMDLLACLRSGLPQPWMSSRTSHWQRWCESRARSPAGAWRPPIWGGGHDLQPHVAGAEICPPAPPLPEQAHPKVPRDAMDSLPSAAS